MAARRRTARPTLWWLCLALASAVAPARAQDVAVVVSGAVEETAITSGELREIYLGNRQYWRPGLRVVPLVWGAEEREQQVLLERVYRMSADRYRQHWITKIFRDEATSKPIELLSGAMLAQAMARLPGAIALVRTDRLPPGAKVLAVDGRRPGEQGYPLR
jgi:hypothetical protein